MEITLINSPDYAVMNLAKALLLSYYLLFLVSVFIF
ncbi:tRNA C32,U32 (ribose-2'-O)-methylase TrmJ [Mucilaginibacter sp. 3215]